MTLGQSFLSAPHTRERFLYLPWSGHSEIFFYQPTATEQKANFQVINMLQFNTADNGLFICKGDNPKFTP